MSFDPNISNNYKPTVQNVNLTQGGGGGNSGYFQKESNSEEVEVKDEFTPSGKQNDIEIIVDSSLLDLVVEYLKNIFRICARFLGFKVKDNNPFVKEDIYTKSADIIDDDSLTIGDERIIYQDDE